ncbi:MAG TPA: LysM peptidoglycan-binding domain-containing protein [Caldilineae bacterium]|nr:LysM peptidoglycan-binding domain-containing protein [Caldilineae bacterium]
MPYLQFSDGHTVPVKGDNFVLGADSVCDLTLEGEGVAPRHAILQFDDDVWRLATLSLQSETKLNGEPVESIVALEEGDELKLGSVTLRWLQREPISAKRFPIWVPVVLLLFICLTGLGLWALIRQFNIPEATPTVAIVDQMDEKAVQVSDADVTEGKSTESAVETAAQEAEPTPAPIIKVPAPTEAPPSSEPEEAATTEEASSEPDTEAEAESTCPHPDGWVQMTVGQGQKLRDIARKAGTQPRLIQEANCLPNTKVKAGIVLWVPIWEGAGSVEAVETTEGATTATETVGETSEAATETETEESSDAAETQKATTEMEAAETETVTESTETAATSAEAETAAESAEAESACPVPDGWVQVTVEAGQRVKDIAQAAGTTPRVIKDANCLPNYKIKAGDTLWVPQPEQAEGESSVSSEVVEAIEEAVETAKTTAKAVVAELTGAEDAEDENACPAPDGWVQVTVEAGQRVKDIAQAAGTTPRVIKDANCLPNYKIEAGDVLWTPPVTETKEVAEAASTETADTKTAAETEENDETCPVPDGWVQVTVEADMKLKDVARIVGSKARVIKEGNCLPSYKVTPGQVIWVPPLQIEPDRDDETETAVTSCPYPDGWVQMTVEKGQKLRDIAHEIGVQPREIKEANCLPNTKVQAGMILWVPRWDGKG